MKLTQKDADLFFELMWALQFFVKQRLQMLPGVKTMEAYHQRPREEKMSVRDALYDHVDLIDAFIQENPSHFSKDKLAIIASWKQFVGGDFYIERLLKKYAVFIASDNKVYGVLALYDGFDEMFYKSDLPFLVKAVLLPFKGQIIYDGLLQGYNVYFGGGITADLKETYMAAKQQGRIILSFDPETTRQARKPAKSVRDWRPELDAMMETAKKMRAGAGHPAIQSPAFKLVRASLELARAAVEEPDDTERLWTCLQKVERARGSVETIIIRAERFR